mmetsp:Transcript_86933/g.241054  ORF Transcript_86933/g.241054 Transcript_86933/m.241054 type:complete len:218 (-) Transcript_86933:2419-3072(-)
MSAALNRSWKRPKHSQKVWMCAVLKQRHFLHVISCDCQACTMLSRTPTSLACTASLSYKRSQLRHCHRPGPRLGCEVTSTCDATQHQGHVKSRRMRGKQGLSKAVLCVKLLRRSFWHMRSRRAAVSSPSQSSSWKIWMMLRMNSTSMERGGARLPGISGKLHFCSRCRLSRSAFRACAPGPSSSSDSSALSSYPVEGVANRDDSALRPSGSSCCCCT